MMFLPSILLWICWILIIHETVESILMLRKLEIEDVFNSCWLGLIIKSVLGAWMAIEKWFWINNVLFFMVVYILRSCQRVEALGLWMFKRMELNINRYSYQLNSIYLLIRNIVEHRNSQNSKKIKNLHLKSITLIWLI